MREFGAGKEMGSEGGDMHMHMHMHMHMDGLSSSCLVVIAHAHVCETLAQTRTCARCDVPIGRRGKLD